MYSIFLLLIITIAILLFKIWWAMIFMLWKSFFRKLDGNNWIVQLFQGQCKQQNLIRSHWSFSSCVLNHNYLQQILIIPYLFPSKETGQARDIGYFVAVDLVTYRLRTNIILIYLIDPHPVKPRSSVLVEQDRVMFSAQYY